MPTYTPTLPIPTSPRSFHSTSPRASPVSRFGLLLFAFALFVSALFGSVISRLHFSSNSFGLFHDRKSAASLRFWSRGGTAAREAATLSYVRATQERANREQRPYRSHDLASKSNGFSPDDETVRSARALAKRTLKCPAKTRRHLAVWFHFMQANAWRTVFDDTMGTLENSALLRECGAEVFLASPQGPWLGNSTSGIVGDFPVASYVTNLNASTSFMHGRVRDGYEFGVEFAESGELATTLQLQRYCRANRDAFVLYLHDKGTRRPAGEASQVDSFLRQADWRRLQEYFLVEIFEDCIAALEAGYNTCGALLRRFPLMHYSGNFYWARCDYVAGLPDVAIWRHFWETHYWAELFIGGASKWLENPRINEGPPCRTSVMGTHVVNAAHEGSHCFEAKMYNCFESRVSHYDFAYSRSYYTGLRCTNNNASYL